jgi:hypothetical protein
MSDIAAEVKAVMSEILDGVVQLKSAYVNQLNANDRRETLAEFATQSEAIERLNSRVDKASVCMGDVVKRIEKLEKESANRSKLGHTS